MEMKYTPGPWEAEFAEAINIRAPHGGLVAQLRDAKLLVLDEVSMVGPEMQAHHLRGRFGALGRVPAPEAEANARLIAAAPDLLEALEAARRQLVTLGGNERLGTDDDQIQAMVLFVIDSALAKAEGGAP